MGQRVIPVAVTAEYIGGDGVTLGAAGSHNSVLIEYDFRSAGPQWDDISGRYVLWTNPQGNNTNRINLGVSEKVEGYEGVYQAAPPADAMCVPGWAEMVVVGFTLEDGKEVTKIKTEPSRFRVLPGSSRAADNEGVAPTVADQLQAEIEAVDVRKVNKPVSPQDPNGVAGQVLMSLGDGNTQWGDLNVEAIEKALANHPEWVTTIQDGAVTENKIGTNAVTTEKIMTGAITADKIATNAVTAGKIAAGAVSASKLANGVVSMQKLADDVKGNLDAKDARLDDQEEAITALKALENGPLKAATASAMTDENRIYVYTGNETGYTAGNWYYHNGASWVSGGVYNATAIETDKTLTVSDSAADAKATGEKIALIMEAEEQTRNLWDKGDVSFTQLTYVYFNPPIPAGDYIFSAHVTSTDTDSYTSKVLFFSGDTLAAEAQLNRNSRRSSALNFSAQITKAKLLASTNESRSQGDTASYIDIQLEKGDSASPYTGSLSAIDLKARADILSQDLKSPDDNFLTHFVNSDGNIRFYNNKANQDFTVYKSANGSISAYKTVTGSDFIRIKAGDYVNIVAFAGDPVGDFYLYFYDQDKNVVWSILDVTDSTTGEKNRISYGDLLALNGAQFSGIPNGYYVRIANITAVKHSILIWNGRSFGFPVTAERYALRQNGSGTAIEPLLLPEDGSSGMILPGDTSLCVIAKPGHTIVGAHAVKDASVEVLSGAENKLPTQCLFLQGVHGNTWVKNLEIVKNYNYGTQTHDPVEPSGVLSDLVVLPSVSWRQGPPTQGTLVAFVREAINEVMAIEWEAKAEVPTALYDSGSAAGVRKCFHAGIKYHGVPYRSYWYDACQVGFHVTKQTFINAANDPDSIFYHTPEDQKVGPYYSLVCSSFGTLVTGFQYPYTTFGYMHSPDVIIAKSNNSAVGQMLSNGSGHCFVPLKTYDNDNGAFATLIAEEEAPMTVVHTVISGYPSSSAGIGHTTNYLNFYQYAVLPKERSYRYRFNIGSGSIKNGSARPYRGDGSVYTSHMDVKINIKNAQANRLYYQEVDVTTSSGYVTSKTATGDPKYVSFTAGASAVVLKASRANGGDGAALEDGKIYAVWASVNGAQPVMPDNAEVFEYRTAEPVVASVDNNGVMHTSENFWYALAHGIDYSDPWGNGSVGGAVTIPCRQGRLNIDGSTPSEPDYSEFRNYFYIDHLYVFFKKGTLGAYVCPPAYSYTDLPSETED